MLKISYESGVGRKIVVKKADGNSSYAVMIEVSALLIKIEVKLSLVEAASFFSKGQTLVAELTHTNYSPVPTKKMQKSGRKASNLP